MGVGTCSDVRGVIDWAESIGRDDPDAALRLLDRLSAPQLRREDPVLRARAAYLRAQMLSIRGEYDTALGAIRSARLAWLTAGEPLNALRTDLGLASVLYEIGEYSRAISVSERLLARLSQQQFGDDARDEVNSIRARANSNLANAHARISDHRIALHHYDLARNLFESLGDVAKVAETDANRAIVNLGSGMVHQGLSGLLSARSRLHTLGLRLSAAKCTSDIAEALLELNQVSRAIAELETCRRTLIELDAVPEQSRVMLVLSRAHLQAGMAAEARRDALQAADVFAELSMLDDSARAILISAMVSMSLGELDRAGDELALSERLFSDCEDDTMVAQVWFAQAHLARRRGEVADALGLATAAIKRFTQDGAMLVTALAHLLCAELLTDPTRADEQLDQARILSQTLAIPSLHFLTALASARLARRSGRASDAARTLRVLLESSSASVVDDSDDPRLRIAKQTARSEASDELVAVLLELGSHRDLVEAWQQASRESSELLNDLRTAAPQRVPGGQGAGQLDTQQVGSWDLPMLSLTGTTAPTGTPTEAGHYESGTPDALRPGRRPQSAVPALPEGPLLQYHVLGADVVAFVIREGMVHVRRLRGATEDTRIAVDQWRVSCTDASMRDHPRDTTRRGIGPALARMYELLVAPVADLLSDLEGGPLLVLPHRHLHGVPFEALADETEPFGARFILRFAMAMAPTPRPEPADPARRWTLVLAAPDAQAPQISAEAHGIEQARSHVRSFIGDGATTRFLRHLDPDVGTIHLACHGRFVHDDPLRSGLHLADGWITARQILDLDLSGTMVILSACSSATTAYELVEPAGVAWALLAAGARGVIASQWAIDDETAAITTRELHAALADNVGTAEALARATHHVQAMRPDPYHWAAFRYFCSPTTALTEGFAPC